MQSADKIQKPARVMLIYKNLLETLILWRKLNIGKAEIKFEDQI